MEHIYSKIDPAVLLHTINRKADIYEDRTNISPDVEFLQLSCKKVSHYKFPAHFHLEHLKQTTITQEAWVIIEGGATVSYYDLDNSLLAERQLAAGDCSITFRGGHSMVTENDTLLYEFKTGPYLGREKDKEWIK